MIFQAPAKLKIIIKNKYKLPKKRTPAVTLLDSTVYDSDNHVQVQAIINH